MIYFALEIHQRQMERYNEFVNHRRRLSYLYMFNGKIYGLTTGDIIKWCMRNH